MAVRRKGWQQLSEAYRRRLTRAGIDADAYEAGVSLGAARGHKTPSGIGERQYANLRKLAAQATWAPGQDPKQLLDDLLAQGHKGAWIRERLKARVADTATFRGGDREPGRKHWQRRNMIIDMAWYWYH